MALARRGVPAKGQEQAPVYPTIDVARATTGLRANGQGRTLHQTINAWMSDEIGLARSDRPDPNAKEGDTKATLEATPGGVRPVLDDAADRAAAFLEGLPEREVPPAATVGELRSRLAGPLPEEPREPRRVVAELAAAVEGGLRGRGGVLGGTTWQGAAATRISVSSWATTTQDVGRSVAAILRAAG